MRNLLDDTCRTIIRKGFEKVHLTSLAAGVVLLFTTLWLFSYLIEVFSAKPPVGFVRIFDILSGFDFLAFFGLLFAALGFSGIAVSRWVKTQVTDHVLDSVRTVEARSLISTSMRHYVMLNNEEDKPDISIEAKISLLKESVVFSKMAIYQAKKIMLKDNFTEKIIITGISASNCAYFYFELAIINSEQSSLNGGQGSSKLTDYYKKQAMAVLNENIREIQLTSEPPSLNWSSKATIEYSWWDVKDSFLLVKYACDPDCDKEAISNQYEEFIANPKLRSDWRAEREENWMKVQRWVEN